MKQGMTNVDVAALAAELAPLLQGARVEKAWQPAKDVILLRLRRKGAGKLELLFELGRFLTLTSRPPANPDKPSMLAQTLRSQLENGRVTGFRQLGFDRLLRMDLERGDGRRALVFELFGDGNLLLLDANDVILLPMRGADLGARRLRKGEPYQPPPGASLPFGLDAEGLRQGTQGSKDVVRGLAVGLGFGPLWAEELCLRAGVEKKTSIDAEPSPWPAVQKALHELGRDIARNDLAPAVVYEDGKPVDAVPFVLQRYPAPRFAHEQAGTFREALDVFFVGGPPSEDGEEDRDDPRRPRFEEAKAKLLHQVEQIDTALADFDVQEQQARLDGDALYASFLPVQAILQTLHAARSGRSWQQVEAILSKARAEGNPAAQQVVQLHPHDGLVRLRVLQADGTPRDVDVDLRSSVQENAESHYAAAKKARSRKDGAQQARLQALSRLADLEAKGLDGFGAPPPKAERRQRHFWFESYRWTITPSGFVAVGGRSAGQNDAVVKKYLRDGDRYVHADAHGAPSVVLRPAEGSAAEFPAEDLRAACQFAACSSRAWRQGGAASAYWVTPAQVSKTPNAGEFVPRGAWMVHGRRNVESNLPLAWGVARVRFDGTGRPLPREEPDGPKVLVKLVGGDPATLGRFSGEVLRLVPGDIEPNEAANQLAQRLGVDVEDAQAVLPAGPVRFEGS